MSATVLESDTLVFHRKEQPKRTTAVKKTDKYVGQAHKTRNAPKKHIDLVEEALRRLEKSID